MKKYQRILLTFLLITTTLLFFFTSPVNGSYQVEVGEKIYYEITKSEADVEFDNIHETFTGFRIRNEIIPEGETVAVNVTSITEESVKWKVLLGEKNSTLEGFPAAFGSLDFAVLFFSLSGFAKTNFLSKIYTDGIVREQYHRAFIFPPILDNAPKTWDSFEKLIDDQASLLGSMLTGYQDVDCSGSYSKLNGLLTLNWWFTYKDSTVNGPIITSSETTFSYNMTTGLLENTRTDDLVTGVYYGNDFEISVITQLKHVAPPPVESVGFNFADFFANNMLYIIGGGVGLIVIIIVAVGIVVSRKKRSR